MLSLETDISWFLSADLPEDTGPVTGPHMHLGSCRCALGSAVRVACTSCNRRFPAGAGSGPAGCQPLYCHGNRRPPCVWPISITRARRNGLTSPSSLTLTVALSFCCLLPFFHLLLNQAIMALWRMEACGMLTEMESVSVPWSRLMLRL